MLVKNKKNTSNRICTCSDSWLKHWKKKTGGIISDGCSVKSCRGSADVGAHVTKYNSTDTSTYIVPLCSEHNHPDNTSSMDIGSKELAEEKC